MSENHSMDVAYIAKLASLELSDREKELFQAQLDQVLAYVDQLNEVELPETISETNRGVSLSELREDVATGRFHMTRLFKTHRLRLMGAFVFQKLLTSRVS